MATGGMKATNAAISAGTGLANLAGAGANMGADYLNKKNANQSQTPAQTQTGNGGNPVQISTMGIFFLVLAIFNH